MHHNAASKGDSRRREGIWACPVANQRTKGKVYPRHGVRECARRVRAAVRSSEFAAFIKLMQQDNFVTANYLDVGGSRTGRLYTPHNQA